MTLYARWLMGTAALFNWSVVLSFLFLGSQVGQLLNLDISSGSNLAMRDLALALIATFGLAYLCAAINPIRARPYIILGAIGKALAALTIFAHWMLGNISWQLPGVLIGDVIYSILFIAFLRRF